MNLFPKGPSVVRFLPAWLLIALLGVSHSAVAADKPPKKEKNPKGQKSDSEHVTYPARPPAKLATIAVEAGAVERDNSAVSVALPAAFPAWRNNRLAEVVDGKPVPVPSQIEPGSPAKLHFTLTGKTPAGAKRTFEIWSGDAPVGGPAVEWHMDGAGLTASFEGQTLFTYHHAHVVPTGDIPREFTRSGYIFPLYSPSGMMITEDMPKDHYHHKGIWFPWTNTQFEGHRVDFWNLGDRSGQVQFAGYTGMTSGPVYGGFQADHQFVDVSQPNGGKIALNEKWDVRVYSQGGPKAGYWLFDLASTQRCATQSPLLLPLYRYGGVAYRGPREWNNDDYVVLTSEGKTKKDGHLTTARWSAHSGAINGKWSTVVVMSHPSNFRHPEPQRIWEKNGCFFNFAPSQAGDWRMDPGGDYRWIYRFFVYEGKIDKERSERAWLEFAHPPVVAIQ